MHCIEGGIPGRCPYGGNARFDVNSNQKTYRMKNWPEREETGGIGRGCPISSKGRRDEGLLETEKTGGWSRPSENSLDLTALHKTV